MLLKGIEDDYVYKGDIICSNHNFCYICNEFEAEVFLTHIPKHKSIMSNGYACVIHLHSAMEEVFIKEIKCRRFFYWEFEEINFYPKLSIRNPMENLSMPSIWRKDRKELWLFLQDQFIQFAVKKPRQCLILESSL